MFRAFALALLTLLSLCSLARAEPRLDRYGDPLPPGAIARLGTDRLRPGEARCAFDVSADGKILATGEAFWVRLWSLADGKELRSIHLPKAFDVYAIHFAPDGKHLMVQRRGWRSQANILFPRWTAK